MKYAPIIPAVGLAFVLAGFVMSGCSGCVALRTRRNVVIQREARQVMAQAFPDMAREYVREKTDSLRAWLMAAAVLAGVGGAGGAHGVRRLWQAVRKVMDNTNSKTSTAP
jgi:hypothetical protein